MKEKTTVKTRQINLFKTTGKRIHEDVLLAVSQLTTPGTSQQVSSAAML